MTRWEAETLLSRYERGDDVTELASCAFEHADETDAGEEGRTMKERAITSACSVADFRPAP